MAPARHALAPLLVVAFGLGCGHRTPAAAPPRPAEVARPSVDGDEGDDSGWSALMNEPAPAPPPPSDTSSGKLLAEAVRQLRAMRTTTYRHKSRVEEETGTFEYDCSGFVAYALRNALPDALAPVPIGIKGRPRAEDFATYFAALAEDEAAPWTRITRGSAIEPGDVIAWLRPADVVNTNTGHIVIVLDRLGVAPPSKAVAKIGGARELLLRVVDSTESPHGDDVRVRDTATGLGTGTIGLVVDGSDAPIGYRWKGGESARAYATLVAIARAR